MKYYSRTGAAVPDPGTTADSGELATTETGIVRLSDGNGFYDAARTDQLPAALVNGRLAVDIGSAPPSGGGGGGPVTVADGADITQGSLSDVVWAGTGNGSLVAISKAEYAKLEAIRALLAGTVAVSLTSVPAHAVSVSNLPAVQPVSDNNGSLTVDGSVNVGNFPATQPVSGAVAVSNLPATQPVSGTFWQATQPVSGAFFQATQPVSLATNTPDVIDRAARLLGHVTVDSAPTTPVTGTFWQATQPVSGPLTDPQLRATPITVREATDTARTNVSLYAEAVAGTVTEALLTLNQSKAFAAATTGTGYTVTAGKTLRILGMFVTWVATTTTANTTRIRLRVQLSGALTLTSPVAYTGRLGWESATFIANEAEMQPIMFPGGIDIPAAATVGISHVEAAANGTLDIQLVAFEF